MNQLKRICVFCGSSPGAQPVYLETAKTVGKLLASEGIGVVYGGASVGLMGAVADAAREAGGEVIGVIPKLLTNKEIAHQNLKDLRVVDSMHERKALMAELSDGFVALPGGFGTFEEICEIITWSQLGLHRKPAGLLNVNGYYNALIEQFDQGVREQFIAPVYRDMVLSASEPRELLAKMRNYQAPPTPKWLRSSSQT
ncbi:MAG: TIGR00730 family Rossman fold protein [Bacteriovoracia bacterium]